LPFSHFPKGSFSGRLAFVFHAAICANQDNFYILITIITTTTTMASFGWLVAGG
jgi:hypothetical protein